MRSKRFLHAEQSPLDWDAPGLVAGVDEAGRGPLAGPVVAAAVILDPRQPIAGLADSKKLTALRRDRQQVLLIDLGSTNGTRLNDRTLTAHQAVKVENGDEIRLGKLLLKINFVL